MRRQLRDGHHAFRFGKPVEHRDKVDGGRGTEPSRDQPVHQLALPFEPTPLDAMWDSQLDALQPAPDDVFDLIEPVRGWVAGRQPRLHHQVLDLRTLARQRQTTAEPNVVSWIASMEFDPSAGNVSRVVGEVLDAYPGPQHARLREAFREWVLGAAESWGIGEEVLEQVKSLKEAGMIYAGVEEQKEQAHREGLGRGRAEGRSEGRAEGRATLVCRLASLKFGARTAERLSRLLEGVTDPERIARIGDRIIECETGEELLARARED